MWIAHYYNSITLHWEITRKNCAYRLLLWADGTGIGKHGSKLLLPAYATRYSPRNVARDYEEDFAAAVDMNVVMTGSGRFVEVQGTGEEATFSEEELSAMLDLARGGTGDLTALQKKALGRAWCW